MNIENTKVGLIGLGIMGIPMAKNLLEAKVDLMVSNRTPEKADELIKLGAKFGTYAEVAANCDFIILMVKDGIVSKEIIFGENGLLAHLKPGTVVCDMSSVTPEESQYCYNGLKEVGVSFVDAPVSGGETGAIAGTMVIMAGGDEEAFEKMKPYFDVLGSSAILVGDSGAGSTAKLVNQVLVNNNIAVVAEGFVLCKKAGADPIKVYDAIKNGFAGSAMLDAKLPRMLGRDFKAGGSLNIIEKDLRNIITEAKAVGAAVPYTVALYDIITELQEHGFGHEDQTAMVRYFEHMAGIESISE